MTLRGATRASEAAHRRVGVVDIGSNSIRLVVYDRLTRAPLPIVNRKAVIGLGTDVERHGRIGEEAFAAAVDAIEALVRIAEDVPVNKLALLATAAVREAENGEAFRAAVTEACGRPVEVLSGDEEGRLSAVGVISAAPDATGIVGDLGGGSLELIAVERGEVLQQTSLPIGPLRLIERTDGRLEDAAYQIDAALASVPWLNAFGDRAFYAVGGAWRAIARLYMRQYEYPLQVLHGFHFNRREASEFTAMLEHLGRQTTAQIRAVSRRRAEALPWGAVLLERAIAATRPSDIVFSAHGLREGFHFTELDPETRLEDPLLAACADLADQQRRFDDGAAELEAWLAPVVARLENLPPRLVTALCRVFDIGWHEHPEYRAEQSMLSVLRMPWSVMSHGDRGFLGLALFVRYGGSASAPEVETCRRIMKDDRAGQAKALGKAMRLASEVCVGRPRVLSATPLVEDGKGLALALTPDSAIAAPDKVERYAASVGRALDRPVRVLPPEAGPPQKKKAAG